jgi:hypothetical protein
MILLPPIRPRLVKIVALAALIALTLAYCYLYAQNRPSTAHLGIPLLSSTLDRIHHPFAAPPAHKHPIEKLIADANTRKRKLLAQESHDLESAASKYRKRRRRHPPPGFDVWFSYAQDHSSVVIEEFFDRIYSDLNPFWALSPHELRRRSDEVNWDHVITVRRHKANVTKTSEADAMNRMRHWHGLILELEIYLPDLNIPFNIMDESRILVPWDEIDGMMKVEAHNRTKPEASHVISNFSGRKTSNNEDQSFDAHWISEGSNQFWDLARQGCAPGSPAYSVSAIDIYHDPANMPTIHPNHSYFGYVSNWTLSRDPCQHAHLRSLHGTFIEPISLRTSKQLLPVFGGSKLPMNNEILIPPAMYLSTEELYAGGGSTGPAWENKTDRVIWRGVASGGRNKVDTWTHFHRHRLLQMLNGTAIDDLQSGRLSENETSFSIPDNDEYPLRVTAKNESLGEWISNFTDVGFTQLWAFPADENYTAPYFEVKGNVPMDVQYESKYLIDVDGNSFSGRFRAFLRSTSLPIKSTIYSEWHDDRLIPWVHFVPMDNTFVDLYGILDFFMGYKGEGGHDEAAALIANEGREWAEKVLRREDMVLYTWRLLLEWARLCDDEREMLGWVDDLL